jgi:hypothetical protein
MTSFGFFLGLSSIALPSLLADIVDYDIWRNRQDRAAIFFSFQALVTKLNQGIGGAIALSIPAFFGFSAREALTDRGRARAEAGVRRLALPAARADAGTRLALSARAGGRTPCWRGDRPPHRPGRRPDAGTRMTAPLRRAGGSPCGASGANGGRLRASLAWGTRPLGGHLAGFHGSLRGCRMPLNRPAS